MSLVTNFGTNGVVIADFSGNNNSSVYNLILDNSNNLIISGNSNGGNGHGNDYAFAKYNLSGDIVTSFGTNGVVLNELYNEGVYNIAGFAVDSNNNIYVLSAGANIFGLAKYDSTGSLVTSFGTSGLVIGYFVSGQLASGRYVTCDNDNNIIVYGVSTEISVANFYALTKYDSNGIVITSFGTDISGAVVGDYGVIDPVIVTTDSDNNIIISGNNGTYGVVLSKYSSGGVLDTSFGTSGFVYGNNSSEQLSYVKINNNNDIFVLGTGPSNNYFFVYKFDSSGNPVNAFGTSGKLEGTYDSTPNSSPGSSLTFDLSGNLIIVGSVYGSGSYGIAKYGPTGVLDTTFGNNGTVVSQYAGDNSSGIGIVFDPTNYLVIAGTDNSSSKYALTKYTNFYVYPCFKEDSKILTEQGYKLVQDLRKGDLVKTLNDGYKAIDMIGNRTIQHEASVDRIKDQLYQCSSDKYPELFEPLVITGCHSILVDSFVSQEQREKTIELLGEIYVTDKKYRLPACADERASVYEIPGNYTIYHLALENEHYTGNYGIYANGLVVETCSKRYLKELSYMELIE